MGRQCNSNVPIQAISRNKEARNDGVEAGVRLKRADISDGILPQLVRLVQRTYMRWMLKMRACRFWFNVCVVSQIKT